MTLVVAHRGAAAYAPENTMEAYRLAVEMGADAIELDVHLTRDGQLAIIHDETLDRTTDLSGPVQERTITQLRGADAGYTFAGPDGLTRFRGKGLRIPTLPEVLDWLPEGIGLVVEVKAAAATEATLEALAGSRVRMADAVSVISFEEKAIDRAHEIDATLPTGYLLVPSQNFESGLAYAVEHGHTAVHPYEGDLGMDPAPKLAMALAFGRQVGCYVVNEAERMRHLAAFGLWGFVTDRPDVGREAMDLR